jgi:HEAT repeat protein
MQKGTTNKDKEIEALLNDLKHPNADKRKMACLALGKAKSASAVDLLIEALNDKEYYVRLEAATALGQIGDAKALELSSKI